MKTRNGFVSNSSSSSFTLTINNVSDVDVSISEWAERNKDKISKLLIDEAELEYRKTEGGEYVTEIDLLKMVNGIVKSKDSVVLSCSRSCGGSITNIFKIARKPEVFDDGTVVELSPEYND